MRDFFLKTPISWIIIPIFIIISVQFLSSSANLLKTPARDFQDFYVTGKWVNSEYKDEGLIFGKDIVRNPPPAMLLFKTFAVFPILKIQTYWFIISIAFFLIGSYFLFKIFNFNNLRNWLLFISLVFIFFPFRYNLGSGQVNNLLFLLICLTFFFSYIKRNYLSSLFLSFAILLKITPLFFLVTLLLEKRTKIFLLTFFNLIALNLITAFILGPEIYQKYLNAPGSFFDFANPVYYNQTLSAFLFRISGNSDFAKFLDLILLSAGIILITFLKRKPFKDELLNRLNLWNISIIYMLIFAPFAWQYHYVIIIFPLLTTFYIGIKRSFNVNFFFFLFLSYLLLGWNIKNPDVYLNYGIPGQIILSHTFFGALILLCLNLSFRKALK